MRLRDSKMRFTSWQKETKKFIKYGAITVAFLFVAVTGLEKYGEYRESHAWDWKFPISVHTHRVLTIREIKPQVMSVIVETEIESEEDLTPIEQKICDKWGMYECKTAIAVAKAESGLNPEAIHYNSNNTYDAGLFQINSIHWEKCGGLKALLDTDNNIECAYQIWSEQGWTPWAVFNNNRFKDNL